MKTASILLIALGFASSATLAQAQSSPGATGGVQSDSQAGEQSQYSIGPSGAQPGTQQLNSESGPPGTGTRSPQSGAHSGMPPHPASGTSGTESGMPAANPDTSGVQPGMPAPPAQETSGASGTQSEMPPLPGTDTSGSSGAQAQPQPGAAMPPMAGMQPKTKDGVTYVCGGVGAEERTLMKREAKKHDMLLTFADTKGELMADVNVAIKDAKGNAVLETTCDGPMMLVDLPKGGKYKVHAVANGHAIDQMVTVAKKPGKKAQEVASVVLSWPTRVANLESGETATATGSSGTGGTSGAGGGKK
ncbi:MAG: hypothetical protein JWM42_771 [Burkholderia sp.]|nr:hypothetical protein [Burkholderia sp.]